MSTTPSLSLKSFFTGSAPNSTTTSTVLPSTKQDVAKAETLPPRREFSLSLTSISRLTLPIAYRQIISLHRKMPDQQDIEEWDRARVNLKLRRSKLLAASRFILGMDSIICFTPPLGNYRLPAVSVSSVMLSMLCCLFTTTVLSGCHLDNASASELQVFDQNHPWLFLYDVFVPEFWSLASAATLLVAVVGAIGDAFTRWA